MRVPATRHGAANKPLGIFCDRDSSLYDSGYRGSERNRHKSKFRISGCCSGIRVDQVVSACSSGTLGGEEISYM